MAHYVYELTVRDELENRELQYIGETNSFKDRFYQHTHALETRKHDNPYLQTFFNSCRYPKLSFKILHTTSGRRTGRKLEREEVLSRDLASIANIEYTERENKAKTEALKTARRVQRNQSAAKGKMSKGMRKRQFRNVVQKELKKNTTAIIINNQWYANARRASLELNLTQDEIMNRVDSNDYAYRHWVYYTPPRRRTTKTRR